MTMVMTCTTICDSCGDSDEIDRDEMTLPDTSWVEFKGQHFCRYCDPRCSAYRPAASLGRCRCDKAKDHDGEHECHRNHMTWGPA